MADVPYVSISFNLEDLYSENFEVRERLRSDMNAHFKEGDLFKFSPEALNSMSNIALGGHSQPDKMKDLLCYIEKNKGIINYAVTDARHYYWIHEGLPVIRSYEKQGHKEINDLILLAEKLYNKLPKIDYHLSPKPRSPQEYLYHWLADGKDNSQEIKRWKESLQNIETVIADLKSIKGFMRKRGKGRPETLAGLRQFVFEMALMYEVVHGKKFTVDKLSKEKSGARVPITDGMIFVFSAMEALHFGSEVNYSPESIYSACEDVKKLLGKITPIKVRKK